MKQTPPRFMSRSFIRLAKGTLGYIKKKRPTIRTEQQRSLVLCALVLSFAIPVLFFTAALVVSFAVGIVVYEGKVSRRWKSMNTNGEDDHQTTIWAE